MNTNTESNITDLRTELSWGEKMKLAKAAKKLEREQSGATVPKVAQKRKQAPKKTESKPACQDFSNLRKDFETSEELPSNDKSASTPELVEVQSASTPELVEVQPGMRWEFTSANKLFHQEVISFAGDSGYDLNCQHRALGVIERAFLPFVYIDARQRPQMDIDLLPPFSPNVKMRITFEIIPDAE